MPAGIGYTGRQRARFALDMRKWRLKRGFVQEALAIQLGVTTQTVRNAESGAGLSLKTVMAFERLKRANTLQDAHDRAEVLP